MSLELFLLPTISRGGGNPFGSLASFENSKHGLEFEEERVGSNKMGQRRLSRKCYTCKHSYVSSLCSFGLHFIFKNMDIGPTLGAKNSTLVT
jgi:hypothetical protein